MDTRSVIRWTGRGLGLAALVGEAAVPLYGRWPRPSFELVEGADTGTVIICHHGHKTTGEKFRHIEVLSYLLTKGHVLLSTDGNRPQDTPRATVRELNRRSLLGREIRIYGLSNGCRTGLRTMRLIHRITRRPVTEFIWESGPFGPKSIDWPLSKAPVAARLLKGGPLSWSLIMAGSLLLPDDEELSFARTRPIYQLASTNMVITAGTWPGEFTATRLLVIEAESDPRIRGCYQQLAPCFGESNRVVLKGAGHCVPHPERVPAIESFWNPGVAPA